MTVNELLQEWVNTDYDTLLIAGANALLRLKPYIDIFADENSSGIKEKFAFERTTLSFIIAHAVFADREITETEQRFITDLFGFNDTTLQEAVRLSSDDNRRTFDMFVESLDREGKGALLDLITSIAACDCTIPSSEKGLLLEIYNRML